MTPFATLIGQQQAVELLTRAVSIEHIAPAYLFSGPEGVGRFLAAIEFSILLLAGEQNASSVRHKVQKGNHPDFLLVEPTYLHQGKLLTEAQAEAEGLKRKAPPQIRVEQVRDIAQFLSRPPLEASRAVVVIKAAHTMAEAAANALLKTLEEPGKATLILIAPSSDELLPTLVSRCQCIPFYRLGSAEMKQVLAQINHNEILEQETVLAIAQGSPGEALSANQHLENISPHLLTQLENLITNPNQSFIANLETALSCAKEIANNLDFPTQLWLANYLQQFYWINSLNNKSNHYQSQVIAHLETIHQLLPRYVQPRLIWEATLLEVMKSQLIVEKKLM